MLKRVVFRWILGSIFGVLCVVVIFVYWFCAVSSDFSFILWIWCAECLIELHIVISAKFEFIYFYWGYKVSCSLATSTPFSYASITSTTKSMISMAYRLNLLHFYSLSKYTTILSQSNWGLRLVSLGHTFLR